MNKKPNRAFFYTGLLLIAAALLLTCYNLIDNYRAEKTSNQVVSQLEELIPDTTAPTEPEQTPVIKPAETVVKAMPEREINGYPYIGTLEVPRYELELPVISQWSYPRLKIAPCRYSGSAYTDDLIISAHNYLSHFGQLVNLEIGDEVLFTDMAGATFRYQVLFLESLEATDIEKMSAGEWDLTLFTCTVGGKYRVTVRCERLDKEVPQETAPEAIPVMETEPGPGDSHVEQRLSAVEETQAAETEAPTEATAPALPDWDTVPLYFQGDYPNTMYGSGTIATSGCSITSLAMVASYLTEHEYLPDELARYFGGRAENNVARLETGSETLKLPCRKSPNWDHTYAALKEGKIAIALMEAESIFTDSQHFIVLTGLTEDGKILVNDSNRANYENWLLRDGFSYGFTKDDILKGYSGAWLYDKNAMPAEPFIYFEPEPDLSNPRYPQIELTATERKLLACVVWAEARGESAEGQQAVAEVVMNRLASEGFPDTLHDVIYEPDAFRTVPVLDDAEPSQAQYEAVQRAIYGPHVLPGDVLYFATYATNKNVWGQIGGHIFCFAAE